jgi:hypothetical protein
MLTARIRPMTATEIKMDMEVKQKWVTALRSGEYVQGDGYLHNKKKDTYCCLGVLCAAMGAKWGEHEGSDGDVYSCGEYVPVLDGQMLSAGEDEELNERALSRFGLDDEIQKTLIAIEQAL